MAGEHSSPPWQRVQVQQHDCYADDNGFLLSFLVQFKN
jgi:hypothetical protein